MTQIPPKKLTLRAFKIENYNLTEQNSGILNLLQQVLTEDSTAAQRRMLLNVDNPDTELLANFGWQKNNSYMFGMMLRVIPAENGGIMKDELFDQHMITMAQVDAGKPTQSQYKDHFYFATNDSYLVTNLSGNTNIGRLQTYLNWLLEAVRGERLFQLTELTKLPKGVELSKIKEIQFVSGGTTVAAKTEEASISTKLSDVASSILESLIGNDTENLAKLRDNQLVEARLVIKLKKRPKEMVKEEFQRVMGAMATNITNDSGIVVCTSDGNRYTGEAIKVKKTVTVDCVSPNRIVEEQLKQEMELFLNEVKAQQNE